MQQPDLTPEEQQLTQSLRRVAAPEGFADRLMARVEAKTPRRAKVLSFRSPATRTWLTGALAATLALGVFLGEQAHIREQQRQQAHVEQQFETAMRVTDQALDRTRTRLEKAGIALGN